MSQAIIWKAVKGLSGMMAIVCERIMQVPFHFEQRLDLCVDVSESKSRHLVLTSCNNNIRKIIITSCDFRYTLTNSMHMNLTS